MKTEIRNRWNQSVIFECEAQTIREACEKATVAGKSLRAANLSAANLESVRLSGQKNL